MEKLFSHKIKANMAKECLTPGAQFHIHISPEKASVEIVHPRPLGMSETWAKRLEDEMHDAMEAIFKKFYIACRYCGTKEWKLTSDGHTTCCATKH